MRILFAPIVALTLVFTAGDMFLRAETAFAQTAESLGTSEDDDIDNAERQTETLDMLFDDLAHQAGTAGAKRIAARILRRLTDSGSDSINLLMERAGTAIKSGKHNVALDLLDQVTILAPDYVEGWNRRATLHFHMKDFSRSLADIERVLALEPRHFGALSGLAIIFEQLDRNEQALETWYLVLAIYPANKNAQTQVIRLEEEMAGKPT